MTFSARHFRLAFAMLCLAAAAPARAEICPDPGPPVYDVIVEVAEARVDFSLDREGIQERFGHIPLPDPQIYHFELGAVMTGTVGADYRINFRESLFPDASARGCVGFNRVTVTLKAEPVIFLSSELRDSECSFKSFLEHELKHVEMDRAVMTDFASRIQAALVFAFPSVADRTAGPVPETRLDDARAKLQASVEGAVGALLTQMMQVRVLRQGEVDTIAEYVGLSRACRTAGPG